MRRIDAKVEVTEHTERRKAPRLLRSYGDGKQRVWWWTVDVAYADGRRETLYTTASVATYGVRMNSRGVGLRLHCEGVADRARHALALGLHPGVPDGVLADAQAGADDVSVVR